MEMICKACGAHLEGDAKFCAVCGSPVHPPQPAQKMKPVCSKCGAVLEDDAMYCAACGAPTEHPAPTPEPDHSSQPVSDTPTSFCAVCGAKLDAGAPFCGSCGAPTGIAPASKPQRTRPVKTTSNAKPKRPRKKINIAPLLVSIVMLAASVTLIIVGIKTIPENIRQASLPYVPVEENEIDDEIQAEYDKIKSDGTLFEIDEEYAEERSHVYYPVYDEEEDAD